MRRLVTGACPRRGARPAPARGARRSGRRWAASARRRPAAASGGEARARGGERARSRDRSPRARGRCCDATSTAVMGWPTGSPWCETLARCSGAHLPRATARLLPGERDPRWPGREPRERRPAHRVHRAPRALAPCRPRRPSRASPARPRPCGLSRQGATRPVTATTSTSPLTVAPRPDGHGSGRGVPSASSRIHDSEPAPHLSSAAGVTSARPTPSPARTAAHPATPRATRTAAPRGLPSESSGDREDVRLSARRLLRPEAHRPVRAGDEVRPLNVVARSLNVGRHAALRCRPARVRRPSATRRGRAARSRRPAIRRAMPPAGRTKSAVASCGHLRHDRWLLQRRAVDPRRHDDELLPRRRAPPSQSTR